MTTLWIPARSSSQPTVNMERNLAGIDTPASRRRCSSYSSRINFQCNRGARSFLEVRCACGRPRVIRSGLDEVGGGRKDRAFLYTRAKPEVRWPEKTDDLYQQRRVRESENAGRVLSKSAPDWEELNPSDAVVGEVEAGEEDLSRAVGMSLARRLEREEMIRKREAFRQRQKGQARRLQNMSRLALRKATDLENRARRLSTAICVCDMARPISNVLDDWPEQLNNEEMSTVVRNVGDRHWRRALELYEWLNSQKWYTPNPRLLATILHILGRANQLEAARELFLKAQPELTSCIQVFNAILGVYAKQGQWQAAEHILELMTLRGCEPDIITFNTIANARCKDGLKPGMASGLLREIESAGLRSDIVTYNTLLGGCIAMKNITEALDIVKEMEQRGFDLDACSSYVAGKEYLNLDERESLVLSTLDETSQLQAPNNNDVLDLPADDNVRQSSASTETLQESDGTSSDSYYNLNRDLKKHLNVSNIEIKEIDGVLTELRQQTEYFSLLLSLDTFQKECDFSKARPFCMRMIESEVENFFSVQGIHPIALKQRSMLRKSSQVWHHPLQFRLLEFFLMILLKHVLKLQLRCSNNNSVKTITSLIEGNMRKYVMPHKNCIGFPELQADDLPQMSTLVTYFSDTAWRPDDESRFSEICLFMKWKTVHVMSPVVQCMRSLRRGLVLGSESLGSRKFRSCRVRTSGWILGDAYHSIIAESYKKLLSCKAAQARDTGEANYILSDVGESDSGLVQVAIEDIKEASVETMNALSYTRLMNECMIRKEYASGVEQLTKMVNAGIEPGYMTWISVLQACVQCSNRTDLLRLLAALRDAGCPLPLRLIMERDAVMSEVETWLRNLQATAADAGQGMVNVLVDILWAFKLRATADHIYDLAVHLDMYPRNFAKVEEQNWEADFRNLSPGTALVALNHWFIEMQRASLDGFPEPQKEVVMITGTQGYQNGVSVNKTIRAHLWEMGSPFYMRPPREGALIIKGHALLLWLKDSPRCFNLELEDSIILPKANSMSFFKGAWMSSDAVPVMMQIYTSIGEVWPRKYSKLAHMNGTRRLEALTARIENEKRRRLEKRGQPNKPNKKKRPPRRKDQ